MIQDFPPAFPQGDSLDMHTHDLHEKIADEAYEEQLTCIRPAQSGGGAA